MARHQSLLFALQPHPLLHSLSRQLPAEQGVLEQRQFPDGESYLRIVSDVSQRHCIVLAELSNPDAKFLPLIFLCETLKELGATSVGLLVPYLPYMRQDQRFNIGEAVTSRIFARLVSAHYDWLVTVDPHLHRYHALSEIYSIPCRAVSGAPVLADWLASGSDMLLVGPDAESEQWVAEIAARSGHPFVVGEKNRSGDYEVVVTLPDLDKLDFTGAVIIDDVISSGHTVLECVRALREKGVENIKCACIHGIFAAGIDTRLMDAGLVELISTNTIIHSSNALDVSALLVPVIRSLGQEEY